MTQVLYQKYRPMTFDQVVGQDHVTQTLRSALALGRVGHAYLFSGPRGTGKTTTARLLAKAVNCLDEDLENRPCNDCRFCHAITDARFLDLIEIDAASNTGVDDVRDLREKINFSPNEGRYKVYIIDEVHMLSTAAFNALLKTLEEPPPHAIFVLATTEAHKIPATVLSRCQRFEFRRIPLAKIVTRLEELLGHEEVEAEPAALDLIARQATGALRDAESLLDQLLASHSGKITLEQAQAVLGTAGSESVMQLVEAWIADDSAGGLSAIQRAVEAGTDPQQFARQLVDYLRGALFFKTSGSIPTDIAESLHEALRRQANALSLVELVAGVKRFGAAVVESKGGWQPQLPLELAFVECIGERRQAPIVERPVAAAAEKVAQHVPAAAATAPAPTTSPAPASADQVTVSQIQRYWNQIRTVLKQRKKYPVEALLNSGQVLGVEDGVVILGFEASLLRDKMMADENARVAESVFSEVIGIQLTIRCVDPQTYQPPKTKPASVELDPEEIKRFAVEELNAEVVETELQED